MIDMLRRILRSGTAAEDRIGESGMSAASGGELTSVDDAEASWSSEYDDAQVPPEAIVPMTIWMF